MWRHLIRIFEIGVFLIVGEAHVAEAMRPPRVHPNAPRYFTDGSGKQQFKAPFEGDAVLHLEVQ